MREFRQYFHSNETSKGWKQNLHSGHLPFELKALNHSCFTHPEDELVNHHHKISPFPHPCLCFLFLSSLSWISIICPAQLLAFWRKFVKKIMRLIPVFAWFTSPLRRQDIYKRGKRKCWGRQKAFPTLEGSPHMERVHHVTLLTSPYSTLSKEEDECILIRKPWRRNWVHRAKLLPFPFPLGARRHLLCSAPLWYKLWKAGPALSRSTFPSAACDGTMLWILLV